MPRKYVRKTNRANIDERTMKLAINDCLKNNIKISEAARQFGIKRTTLQSRIKTMLKKKTINEIVNSDSGNESVDEDVHYSSKYTVKQVFTMEQEDQLKEYIKHSSNLHYGLSYQQIRILAFQFAKSSSMCKIPENWETNKMAGKDWMLSFMKRHSDLSLRKPESTSISRSMAFNKPVVEDFFDKYAGVLAQYKFGANQIWNLDETGITTVMRSVKVVSTKGKKQVGQIASGERGVLVTFVGIISAVGTSIPPVFVYPRLRNPSEYLSEQAPAGSIALGNKSGWMTSDLFPEVLKHIVEHTRCSAETKILLIVDNHESHISVEAIRYCKSNGIVLLSFPPHTTHRLQPLDVGVYSSFKSNLATASNDWMLAHPGQAITIRHISYLANKAFVSSFSLKNIQSGFKKTGLWPPDRLVFEDSDFAASSVTDKPNSETIALKNDNYTAEKDNKGPEIAKENCNIDQPTTSNTNATEKNIRVSSLEEIRPYPKADLSKKRKRTRKSKSTIYTDTPELTVRENIELEKRRRQSIKTNKAVKRAVFLDKIDQSQKSKAEKVNLDSSSSDSDASLDDICSKSSDDLEEFETLSNAVIDNEDFVLVKFPTKSTVVHYIGQVLATGDTFRTIKFMRRKGSSQTFLFPDIEDIADVDLSDIIAKLHPPIQNGTARTASIFTFNYNFTNLVLK